MKRNQLNIRISDIDRAKLDYLTKTYNLNISQYIRHLIDIDYSIITEEYLKEQK